MTYLAPIASSQPARPVPTTAGPSCRSCRAIIRRLTGEAISDAVNRRLARCPMHEGPKMTEPSTASPYDADGRKAYAVAPVGEPLPVDRVGRAPEPPMEPRAPRAYLGNVGTLIDVLA